MAVVRSLDQQLLLYSADPQRLRDFYVRVFKFVDLIAATADGGILAEEGPYGNSNALFRLDASGNYTSTPLSSAPLNDIRYSWQGDPFGIDSGGSLDMVSSNSLAGALSVWAMDGGSPSHDRAAGRSWYFTLAWQNAFTLFPAGHQSLASDLTSYSPVIKAAALEALKRAYKGFPIEVSEGAANTGDDWAIVLNETD